MSNTDPAHQDMIFHLNSRLKNKSRIQIKFVHKDQRPIGRHFGDPNNLFVFGIVEVDKLLHPVNL